ncbi:hypothetical protein POM88_036286 [Heracleum sosnowskyi]|uniref:Uncharacterized protein n=1 Tax=Heracleum sosnowskyi TaxID=360622 RepID=A0AAD8HN23_9APIA|nr:hypothetical protein POM88_036286 [Heracleum sosnowskyi]
MAVSSNDMILSQQIEEFGNKLAEFPTEIYVLLPLLDRVDVLLSQVEQSPSRQLLDACSIPMKALVQEPLLKHSDNDVRVYVASCLCEVFRITAPETPYEDAEMKETFQLIVSSFKEMADMSSRSFSKQVSILDNVARVRSPVVMLDLECDSLIVEMFHNFLGSIRDCHPESVFTHMKSIMTLVIEESEDVTLELLTPILGALKKDKENTQTISRKLGEKVLETCKVKVKPYLLQVVKSLDGPLSQYSAIVACICEEAGVVEHHDDNGSINQLDKAEESLDEPASVIHLNERNALLNVDVTKDSKAEVESPKLSDDRDNDKDTLVDKDSHVNTLASTEIEKELALVSSPKHFENEVADTSFESHNDKSLSTKENPTEGTPIVNPLGIDVGDVCGDLQVTRQMDCKKMNSEASREDKAGKEKMVGDNTPPGRGTSSDVVEVKISSDDVAGRISDSKIKAQKNKIMSSTQDAPCDLGSLKDADRAFNLSVKRQKRSERKQMNLAQEDPKQDIVGKNDVNIEKGGKRISTHFPIDIKSDGTTSGDSETKPLIKEIAKRLSGKKQKARTSNKPEAENVKNEKEKGAIHHSPKKQKVSDLKRAEQKNESVEKGQNETNASDPDEKLIKYFKKGKKGNAEKTGKGKENTDVKEDKASPKKKRKAESVPDAEILKQPAKRRQKADDKDNFPVSSPKSELASKSVKDGKHLEDSKVKSNRKQTTGKNKSGIAYGENLVDSKIKVWWKDDHEFYEGVIVSFNLEKKKHEVLYDDGEIEILNLKNERWEFVKDGTIKNKQEDKESDEGVSAKASRSKAVKSKKGGGKSPPDNDESIMPKSNSKSNKGKSASKSKSSTPQVGTKSDVKGKRRS